MTIETTSPISHPNGAVSNKRLFVAFPKLRYLYPFNPATLLFPTTIDDFDIAVFLWYDAIGVSDVYN